MIETQSDLRRLLPDHFFIVYERTPCRTFVTKIQKRLTPEEHSEDIPQEFGENVSLT